MESKPDCVNIQDDIFTADDNPDALGTIGKNVFQQFFPESPVISPEIKTPQNDPLTISALRRDSLQFHAPEYRTRYFMGHRTRGMAFIINNRNFEKSLRLEYRSGSDIDADSLEETFSLLGFPKSGVYRRDDMTCREMISAMNDFAKADFSEMDCFVCAILTHGKEDVLYGIDGKTGLVKLLETFKLNVNPTLRGKPKILLVQACRGNRLDNGADLEADSPTQRVALEADFLYAYSTVPGYFSWRNSLRGSWFIQAFVKIVKENHKNADMDLVRILTRVNYEVAYHFESNVPGDAEKHHKKQMPSVVTMLTKELFFT